MSPSRLKLIGAVILILVMAALMLWFPSHAHRADAQPTIDQAGRDVAAAKAAADSAAQSAAEANEAARNAQNQLPGSS